MGQRVSKTIKDIIVPRVSSTASGMGKPPPPPPPPPAPPSQLPRPQPKVYPEMPPDMIKFLVDVGPVKKLSREESQERQTASAERRKFGSDPQRRVVSTPLFENFPGVQTPRTTNFSNSKIEEEEGLSVDQIHELLTNRLKDIPQFEDKSKQKWIEHTTKYLEVPIIVTHVREGVYLGISPAKANDILNYSNTLKVVDPTEAEFALASLPAETSEATPTTTDTKP